MAKRTSNRLSPPEQDLLRKCQQMEELGRIGEAQVGYKVLLQRHPDHPYLRFCFGFVSIPLKQYQDAERSLRRATELDPTKGNYFAALAMAQGMQAKLADADASSVHAVSLAPNDSYTLYCRAEVLRMQNRGADAYDLLRGPADGGKGPMGLIGPFASAAGSSGHVEEGIGTILATLEREDISAGVRTDLLYRLGSLRERQEDWAGAWSAFEEAAPGRKGVYKPDEHEQWVSGQIELWSGERMRELPRSKSTSELPVFIVGMPRSGTTLVEQIIASHPLAFGAGERLTHVNTYNELLAPDKHHPTWADRLGALRAQTVDRVARRELRAMQALDPHAKRITDKRPQNFLLLGLAELLYPNCRVVHVRRDPLDTCVSCFTHDFGSPQSQPYSYDLEQLAHYYKQYERMMEHWTGVLGVPVLEIEYEKLVGDLEGESRRLIDFVGLEWHDACLRFHETERAVITHSLEQVRRPLYSSSVGRWKRYEQHLGPLIEALGAAEESGI